MKKILKGDNVLIRKGKDRGKTGKVENVVAGKVVVGGVNIYKKHGKPTKKNPKGGIIDIAIPVRGANVSLVCPSCTKATRIGIKKTKERKYRYCKKCNAEIMAQKGGK